MVKAPKELTAAERFEARMRELERAKAARTLPAIFEEEPCTLDTFLHDKRFLNQPHINLTAIQHDFLKNFELIYSKDTYDLMAEEFGSYWKVDKPVIPQFYAVEWGKGSQAPHTPIYDAKTGIWSRLDSFKGGPVASAYPEDGKVQTLHGSESFLEGYGRMFRVTTKSGLTTEVWEGHRYLIKGAKWKRLWDLSVGDHIAVSSYVPEPIDAKALPIEHIEILGLFLGDGCSPSNPYNAPSICGGKNAVKTKAKVMDLLSSLPNSRIRVAERNDGKWDVYTAALDLSKNRYGASNPLRQFLKKYGAENQAKDKKIPEACFSLPTDQVAVLVSRLIDTDGWVSISNTVEVGYGSISYELVEGVRRLLLRLGVASGIRQKNGNYNGKPHVSYQLKVRDRKSVQRLLRQLNLLDKEPFRLTALEWCEQRDQNKSKAMHGDLWWDKITSIEYVGEGEYWTLSVDGPASYISNSGILDHNSGKDFVVRLGIMRIVYLLLCLKSPQSYFSMPSTESIHLLNVATNADQARRIFFAPMRKALVECKWFEDKFDGEPPAPLATSVRFIKQIEAVSGHSMADSMEGLNLLAGVADEIAAFRTDDEIRQAGPRGGAKSAEGILNMMRSSGRTRFPKNFKMVQISFPRYDGDAIMQAIAEANANIAKYGDHSQYYSSGPHPTWEVRPGQTKALYAADYEKNYAEAQAKYECKPEGSGNLFFKNGVLVDNAFTAKPILPGVEAEYYWGIDPTDENSRVPGWQVKFNISPSLVPMQGAVYTVHCDIALTKDRAGIAMSHVRNQVKTRHVDDLHNIVYEDKPIVRTDFAIGLEADMSAHVDEDTVVPREIQVRWFKKLINELVERGFYIGRVTADSYQSADMLQSLMARGIESAVYSLDRKPEGYETLRDLIYESRLEADENELAVRELKALVRLQNGKVDHLPGRSKDVADAIAGSVVAAIELGGSEGDEPLPVELGRADVFGSRGGKAGMEISWGGGFMGGNQDVNMFTPSTWQ